MRTFSEIAKDLINIKGFKTQAELARYFNVKPNTITTWKARNMIPFELIIAFCERDCIDAIQLLTGEGLKHLDDLPSHPDKKGVLSRRFDEYEEQIIVLLKGMDVDRKKKVLEMMEKEQLLMNLLGERDDIKILVEARSILMDLVEERKKATEKHRIYKEEEKEE